MGSRGGLGISCPACGGTLFQMSPKRFFCANTHCKPGGRMLDAEQVVDAPGSSTSKCILDECTFHGRGRDKDDSGNRTNDAREEQVLRVS